MDIYLHKEGKHVYVRCIAKVVQGDSTGRYLGSIAAAGRLQPLPHLLADLSTISPRFVELAQIGSYNLLIRFLND